MPDDKVLIQPGRPFVLDQERLANRTYLGSFTRDSIEISFDIVDLTRKELVASIEAFVLSEKLVEESKRVSFKAPATWFEHLKETLYMRRVSRGAVPWWNFERWLWQRWLDHAYDVHPVRYTTEYQRVTFTAKALYPYADIARPKEFGHMIVHQAYSVEPDDGPWSPSSGR